MIAKSIFKKVPEKFVAAKVTYSKKYQTELSRIGECVTADTDDAQEEVDECCGGHEDKKTFEIVDLDRPLEGDCAFELIDFESPEGREVNLTFLYSTIHLLSPSLNLGMADSLQGENSS